MKVVLERSPILACVNVAKRPRDNFSVSVFQLTREGVQQLHFVIGRLAAPETKPFESMPGKMIVLSDRQTSACGWAQSNHHHATLSMPICEVDPWRLQYFSGANCPREVNVPTEDCDAWRWNPDHRWVYDKIAIARSQRLAAGPHGTEPPRFPVFSKPRINLRGMGVGGRVLNSRSDYRRHRVPDYMWMTLLAGTHVSSDAAVVAGEARWWHHVTGLPAGEGTFDYWIVHAEPHLELEGRLARWIARHLRDYTGMLNLETIGGVIIEVHLRITDQWPDLYGAGWVDAVVALYHRGDWVFADAQRSDGFSVVLFGPGERPYRHPPQVVIEDILRMPGISSVQITFHEDRDPASHAMPPGGFRLAIVNCHNLGAGLVARERLRACFPAAKRNTTFSPTPHRAQLRSGG